MSKKNKNKENDELKDEQLNAEQNSDEQKQTDEQEQQNAEEQKPPVEDEWQGKYNQLNDKHLRLFSEFDNYRKRTMREKADLIKSAAADLIKEMLPLIDDMDRAIKAVPVEQKEAREGMELIRDKFVKLLRQKGLEEMDSQGKEFNTDYHEAITQIDAPQEDLKGKVVDVIEKGYFLNDKILRFAKVVVGK